MSKTKTLTWSDKFALINHFKPTDDQILETFGGTADELAAARELAASGTITPAEDIDYDAYSHLFNPSASVASGATEPASDGKSTTETKAVTKASSKKEKGTTTSTKKPGGKAETATKKTTSPKKRGRKGDKIANAFKAIPKTPTEAEKFAADHSVSLAVLRQSKRFDRSPDLGKVRVKKDKATQTLMIWREDA